MSEIETRAAALHDAWRNAQDLAPVKWEQLDERERAVWSAVAAAAVPASEVKRKQ